MHRRTIEEKAPAGEAGAKCLGSLGVGSGHHSPVVKGFRLSTGLLALRGHDAHGPARAGFGAHVADARTVEVRPGLLAAGEAGLHVEAVALAGRGLGYRIAAGSRDRIEARRKHERARDERGSSYGAVNLEHLAHPVPEILSRRGPSLS